MKGGYKADGSEESKRTHIRVSEELRAAAGGDGRSGWPELQETPPKMKCSRRQVTPATDSSHQINASREAPTKWKKNFALRQRSRGVKASLLPQRNVS